MKAVLGCEYSYDVVTSLLVGGANCVAPNNPCANATLSATAVGALLVVAVLAAKVLIFMKSNGMIERGRKAEKCRGIQYMQVPLQMEPGSRLAGALHEPPFRYSLCRPHSYSLNAAATAGHCSNGYRVR